VHAVGQVAHRDLDLRLRVSDATPSIRASLTTSGPRASHPRVGFSHLPRSPPYSSVCGTH
jgi:hypothetical protein